MEGSSLLSHEAASSSSFVFHRSSWFAAILNRIQSLYTVPLSWLIDMDGDVSTLIDFEGAVSQTQDIEGSTGSGYLMPSCFEDRYIPLGESM